MAQRSLVATLEITASASLAHVLAGGHLPAAGFLFAFGAVVFALCLATIGRFLRLALVVPVVLAAQIGLHAVLDVAPAAHHAAMHQVADAPLGLTPVMVWAHTITALVTAILLLLQERVVAAVASLWWPVVVPVLPRLRALRHRAVPALVGAVLYRLSPRRGPPAALLATT